MKKKVLFVIDSLDCGGAEKSLISLLPLLDYKKLSVDLMIIKRGGIFERYIPSSVRIISISRTWGVWFELCLIYFRLLLRFFRQRHGAELRWKAMATAYPHIKNRYDVAIAYQQGFPTYYVASKVYAEKKIAWVNADIKKAGYREGFNRFYYDRITTIVPVSDVLSKMLASSTFVDGKRLYTVYDILNVDLIKEMSKAQGFSDILPKDFIRILTVGRMESPKNYPLAVKTARILKDKGLSFRWYFIGDGSERPHVEELISQYGLGENIHLLGLQQNPYPYMAGCNIYVQTSSFEGFGLTLNEARILNKPEVSTDFPVVYDQIQDGKNGLIAKMNPDDLAEKILTLANDHQLRERIVEATKKEINETARTESLKVNKLLIEK